MRIKLLTILLLGFSGLTQAQKFSHSPFSASGIGEFGGLDHALFGSLGNSSIALIDTTILNFNNPSSYASLGVGQPLFSTGISSRFSAFSSGDVTANNKYIGLDHFALAVPFAKKLGIAFGLKPFSRTGYEFYELQVLNDKTMKYIYRGSGGTHLVFTGFSANLFQYKHHRLALGANAGYVFGTTLNERISYIDNSYSSTDAIPGGVENKGYTVKAFNLDIGMHYNWDIDKNKTLQIGAIYTPQLAMNAVRNEFLAATTNVNDPNKYSYQDTIVKEKGTISMPSTIGLGATFIYRTKAAEGRRKVGQILITGEMKMTDWSTYHTTFGTVISTENFANTTSFSAGIQYTPHNDYKDKTVSYLNRIRYRGGFQYATLPIVTMNKQQTSMRVTAGIGFPFATQRSSSSINLSLVAGKQGTGNTQSINEHFLGINFGVTISPGFNDRWFRKFKID
jgi:hypothetical protein